MCIRTLLSLALAVLASALAPAAQAQQLLYIHADHLNTPRLVTNGSGTPVWRWDQTEPFGDNPPNEDPDGNSILGHMPLRFPGQYFDKETNLTYNMERNYDAGLGRYIEADPLGVMTAWPIVVGGQLNHPYSYAANDPLRLTDPDGLQPCAANPSRKQCIDSCIEARETVIRTICNKLPTQRGRVLCRNAAYVNSVVCIIGCVLTNPGQ